MPQYNDYDENRVLARDVDVFMGMARMLSMKPMLDEVDVRSLATWLGQHRRIMDQPMVRPIADNITSGLLLPERRNALHHQLRAFSGDIDGDGVAEGPTSIAYTDPAPDITFADRRFCFTGTFDWGGRWECEEAVEDRGGHCGAIAKRTHYLVIGAKSTDSWKHGTFGDKINKAMAWRAEGFQIAIVSEKHWVRYL